MVAGGCITVPPEAQTFVGARNLHLDRRIRQAPSLI